MGRHTITFTLEMPEHETDECPSCRATDVFDNQDDVPELYCKNDWHIAEKVIQIPAVWDICNRCKGDGTHTNPNVDGHGISAEEWEQDWDEESREMYMNGGYDVRCEAGCTDGKVLVPDEEACKAEPLKSQLEAYEAQQERIARYDREDRQMRYMESGGREGSRY